VSRRVGGVKVVVASGLPGVTRVGFAVGREVGGAVLRNRVKRRLREAMARVSLQEGHDYVVTGTEAVTEATFPEVVEMVRRAVGG
jgi:ribonuclease P protein component